MSALRRIFVIGKLLEESVPAGVHGPDGSPDATLRGRPGHSLKRYPTPRTISSRSACGPACAGCSSHARRSPDRSVARRRPQALDQLAAADHLAGAREQRGEDQELRASQLDRLPIHLRMATLQVDAHRMVRHVRAAPPLQSRAGRPQPARRAPVRRTASRGSRRRRQVGHGAEAAVMASPAVSTSSQFMPRCRRHSEIAARLPGSPSTTGIRLPSAIARRRGPIVEVREPEATHGPVTQAQSSRGGTATRPFCTRQRYELLRMPMPASRDCGEARERAGTPGVL